MRLLTAAVAALLAAALLFPVTVALLAVPGQARPAGLAGGAVGVSGAAVADVPAGYLALYQQAAASCPGLAWQVLAAVGKVETDHGRLAAPGVAAGANTAGAAGPMQFGVGGRAGDTWATAGVDGDGDGRADVYDPADAIPAAAGYLCAHGATRNLRGALLAYNHASWYVDQVLAQTAAYSTPPPAAPGTGGVDQLLTAPGVTVTAQAAAELRAGIVDPRLVTALAALAAAGHQFQVDYVKGDRTTVVGSGDSDAVSNHFYGRAVDISIVGGRPVSAANPAARALVLAAADLRIPEVGGPFGDLDDLPGVFSNAAHADHLHLGYYSPTTGRRGP